AFGAFFTDEGVVAFAVSNGAPPEITPEEARAALAELVGPPLELQSVDDITVSDDTASATIVILTGGNLSADRLEFTLVGDEWLVSDYAGNVEPVAPPAGYASVP